MVELDVLVQLFQLVERVKMNWLNQLKWLNWLNWLNSINGQIDRNFVEMVELEDDFNSVSK